jgi:23S rRNA (adenine2503-C2)-methyltransferase
MQLLGLNTSELENTLREMGEGAFRGRQIAEWIYKRGATSFDAMSNISRDLRARLAEEHELHFPEVAARHTSRCAMACAFCATGLGGFRRNLKADEIIAQPLLAMGAGEWGLESGDKEGNSNPQPQVSSLRPPTHIVFMGMGEPLLNLNNVLKAIYLMHDEIGIPMRHITVSTVGILPGITKLAEEKLQLTLAISLHAPEDELRHRLIPTSTKTKVSEIIAAARHYARHTGRRVTFEYVMLGGVNDQLQHAKRLAKLCAGWPCHVNLIPWNPVPGAKFEGQAFDAPTPADVRQFKQTLESAGVATTQRVQRGADVAAACGQLRANELRAGTQLPVLRS